MKPLAILILLALPCLGQITSANPTSLAFIERSGAYEVYPKRVALTGTGALAATTSGALATPLQVKFCTSGLAPAACDNITAFPVGGPSDGTADCFIYFDGYNDPFTAGVYTGTVSLNSGQASISVTLTVVKYEPPQFNTLLGSKFPLCTTAGDVHYAFPELCTPPNLVPGPGTAFDFGAAVGNTITDPVFGGIIKTATLTDQSTGPPPKGISVFDQDSIVTAWNSDGTLLQVSWLNGQKDIIDGVTHAVLWTDVAHLGSSFGWSSLNPKVFFWTSGNDRHRVLLGTAPAITSDVTIYTYPGTTGGGFNGGSGLIDGGDSEISKDDWYLTSTCAGGGCLTSGTDTKYVLINQNCNTTACATAYTGSFGSFWPGTGPYALRTMDLSRGVDIISGLRYLLIEGGGGGTSESNHVVTFNPATTTFSDQGYMPIYPGKGVDGNFMTSTCTTAASVAGRCYPTGHITFVDINGEQYLAEGVWGRTHSSYFQLGLHRMNAGVANFAIDEADGGGYTYIYTLDHQDTDSHISAVRQGNYLLLSHEGPGVVSFKVTNAVTSGANLNLTLDRSPGSALQTGDTASVASVPGCTNANGTWASVTVVGSTLTLPSVNCNGAFPSIGTRMTGGVVTKNVLPTITPTAFADTLIHIPYPPGHRTLGAVPLATVTFLWHARDIQYNTGYFDNGYYGQQHTMAGQSNTCGTAIPAALMSNVGRGDRIQIYSARIPNTCGATVVSGNAIMQ